MTVLKTREIDNAINPLAALGDKKMPDMLKDLKKANGEVADRLKAVQEREGEVLERDSALKVLEGALADREQSVTVREGEAEKSSKKAADGLAELKAARSSFQSWSKAEKTTIDAKQAELDAALAEIDRDKKAAQQAKVEALDLRAKWEAAKEKAEKAFS